MWLRKLIVVSPYLGPRAFASLVSNYGTPREAVVVTDTSTPASTLTDCAELLGGARALYAPWPGLLHAKLLVFEFEGPLAETSWWASFGSANVSVNGLSASGNIELHAGGRVAATAVEEWAHHMLNGTSAPELLLRWGELTARLPRLPDLVDRHAFEAGQCPFDAWLRAGQLVHKWTPASDFARVTIEVKDRDRRLTEVLDAVLEGRGAGSRRLRFLDTERVNKGYMRGLPRPQPITTNWRAKFATETILGHWVSRRCANEEGSGFEAENARVRRAEVARLRELADLSPSERRKTRELENVRSSLKSVIKGVREAGYEPEAVFSAKPKAMKRQAVEKALKVIDRDSRRAQVDEFATRHIRGTERFAVPGFAADTPSWERFVRSWVESVALEAEKARGQSLVMKALTEMIPREMKVTDFDERVEAILTSLRRMDGNIGPLLEYHLWEKQP